MFQALDSSAKRVLGPDHFEMAQSLLQDFCRNRVVDPAGGEAQEAARERLGWLQIGVTDEQQLRELLNSRNDPSSPVTMQRLFRLKRLPF